MKRQFSTKKQFEKGDMTSVNLEKKPRIFYDPKKLTI